MMGRVRGVGLSMYVLLGWACGGPSGIDSIEIVAVQIVPDSAGLMPGDTVRLIAQAVDGNGVPFAGTDFLWQSSDDTVAVVSQDGLAQAQGAGTTTITATSATISGRARVVVDVPPLAVPASTTVSFAAAVGGANPADQTVAITNGGGGTLDDVTVGAVSYGAGQATGWLTVELSGAGTLLTIRVDVSGLTAGTFDATVAVGVAGRTDATLAVTLVVS